MKLSPQATKGHLIVGMVLLLFSFGSLLVSLFTDSKLLPFLIFFFGIWGGIETGRYLEFWLEQRSGSGEK